MSQTRDDRIAERPSHLCAAYGCPMLGSMASSTSGTSEWWCFAHFGKDAGQLQRITTELRSLDWLSKAVTDIRMRHLNRGEWPKQFQRIDHDLYAAGHDELRYRGNPASRMDTELWLQQLEADLDARVRAIVVTEPVQTALPVASKDVGTFGRVGFEVPA